MISGTRALWEQGLLLDYTIEAGRRQFPVHKVILAAVSDYFKVMLTGSLMESQENSVHLKGVTAGAVQSLIRFIYTDELELNEDNVNEILAGAVHLQIPSAIKACAMFLVQHLDIDNCIDVLTICRTYSLDGAVTEVLAFVKVNSQNIIAERKVDFLPFGDLHLVIDDWPRSEWDLFLCLKQWVSADNEERTQHLDVLMQQVRFSIMSQADLLYIKRMDIYSNSKGEWQNLVDRAVEYYVLPIHKKLLDCSEQTEVRNKPAVVVLSIDVDGHYTSEDFFALQESWCWRRLPAMTHTSLQASIVTVNNFLVVCGGSHSLNLLQTSAKCFIFDPRTHSWAEIASMNNPRKNFALVAHGQCLYAIGGCTGYRVNHDPIVTGSIERYDISNNTWSVIVDLPREVRKHGAVTYKDSIYVSGGIANDEAIELGLSRSLDCLDVETQTWTSKAPMLTSRFDHLMCAMQYQGDEVIFVVGLNLDLEYYNMATDQWSRCFIMSKELPAYATMLAHGNSVYFIAGRALFSSESEDSDSDASAQFHEDICVKLILPEDGTDHFTERLPPFPIADGIPLCALLAIPNETMDDSTLVFPERYVYPERFF